MSMEDGTGTTPPKTERNTPSPSKPLPPLPASFPTPPPKPRQSQFPTQQGSKRFPPPPGPKPAAFSDDAGATWLHVTLLSPTTVRSRRLIVAVSFQLSDEDNAALFPQSGYIVTAKIPHVSDDPLVGIPTRHEHEWRFVIMQ